MRSVLILLCISFYLIFSPHAEAQVEPVAVNVDLRECNNPCSANDFIVNSVFVSTTNDGVGVFDPTLCMTGTEDVFICFSITNDNNSDRGAIYFSTDLYEDGSLNGTQLICFPGPYAGRSTFTLCSEYTWTCGTTLDVTPGYIGFNDASEMNNPCNPDATCRGGGAAHPPAMCIGYFDAEVICTDDQGNPTTEECDLCVSMDRTDTDMDGIPDDCDIAECAIQDFNLVVAPEVEVNDAFCDGDLRIEGTLAEPQSSCPDGSMLQYSTDQNEWTDVLPEYDQGIGISVYTRCVCENEISQITQVMTDPQGCVPIPTLSEWGVIILMLLLMIFGVLFQTSFTLPQIKS